VDPGRIEVPSLILTAIGEDTRKYGEACYKEGYKAAWSHSSGQYTNGKGKDDFLFILSYLLERRNIDSHTRADLLHQIKKILPTELDGNSGTTA
jgi:hypothetical protein